MKKLRFPLFLRSQELPQLAINARDLCFLALPSCCHSPLKWGLITSHEGLYTMWTLWDHTITLSRGPILPKSVGLACCVLPKSKRRRRSSNALCPSRRTDERSPVRNQLKTQLSEIDTSMFHSTSSMGTTRRTDMCEASRIQNDSQN